MIDRVANRVGDSVQRRWMALAVCLILMMLTAIPTVVRAADAPSLSVESIHGDIDLRPYLALMEDPSGSLGFDQVRAAERQGAFETLGDMSPNFGFTQSAWWVRLTLSNTTDSARQFIIRQDYPLIDHIDFWAPSSDDGWSQTSTGDRVPFAQRPLDNRQFLFPVTLPAHSEASYYLRFQTEGSLNIGLYAHTPDNLLGRTAEEYLALGIYYGGFIVLLVYNLIMFMTLREKAFAYYTLYVLSYGLYMSVHNGLSFQYLWPDNSWLANQSLIVLLALSLFGGLRFTREILSTAQLCPRLDKVAYLTEWGVLLSLLLSPVLSYKVMIIPMAGLTSVVCLEMLVLGVLTLFRGSSPARYYCAAFGALLGGVFAYMLKTFGLLPHNALTQNAFQVGSLIEMVLLSLAIGSRLNEIKRQNNLDALTRVYNRRCFNEQIDGEFQKTVRRSQALSLLVLDIDHFKRFNDTYGHARGDHVLKVVAQILSRSVRKPGAVYRYGGEEFAVILPGTGDIEAHAVAERIRQKIESETADSERITVSIGSATQSGDTFCNPQALFDAADSALYSAKEQGRNCTVQYQHSAFKAEIAAV
ncbi:Signaling protein [Marinobacterium lacunae]|uniref:diguanylate cyclase n=1 Tax=Marinobacterium lacunae TaxID=1232683 RepID=A0A081G1D9_9GAMM|nr:diguanylate cyclase [Marinobacterium lacunae]KEA64594.1 Signaling protein [Marinobacterium lacunae]